MRFNTGGMNEASTKVYVSRVDGNHRLYHARGDDRRAPLLLKFRSKSMSA